MMSAGRVSERRRAIRTLILSVGLVGAAAGTAHPQRRAQITPKFSKHTVTVLHDSGKHTLIVLSQRSAIRKVFYSIDGKSFFQQSSSGGSTRGIEAAHNLRDPRVTKATLHRIGDKWTVHCDDRKTPMSVADSRSRKSILARAKYYAGFHGRIPHALARDFKLNYYYVDRNRDDLGGAGYRLYVGRKGRLNRQRLLDMVADSVGSLFETPRGVLAITRRLEDKVPRVVWTTAKGRGAELTHVPLSENRRLIYEELGVYQENLGLLCDDL